MENVIAYQISPSVNDGILEVVITGSSIGTFEKMMYEVDAILEANGAKEVIFDIRSYEEHIESTAFYQYARKHNFFIYGVKTAVVDLQEKTSFAIALRNAGVPVERFADIDLARKWIKRNPIKETWV
jgi:hypothetical protein